MQGRISEYMARLPCNLVAMKVQHCNKVFLCGCNATFLKCCIVIAKRFPSVVAMQPFCNENAMLHKPFFKFLFKVCFAVFQNSFRGSGLLHRLIQVKFNFFSRLWPTYAILQQFQFFRRLYKPCIQASF